MRSENISTCDWLAMKFFASKFFANQSHCRNLFHTSLGANKFAGREASFKRDSEWCTDFFNLIIRSRSSLGVGVDLYKSHQCKIYDASSNFLAK